MRRCEEWRQKGNEERKQEAKQGKETRKDTRSEDMEKRK